MPLRVETDLNCRVQHSNHWKCSNLHEKAAIAELVASGHKIYDQQKRCFAILLLSVIALKTHESIRRQRRRLLMNSRLVSRARGCWYNFAHAQKVGLYPFESFKAKAAL